MRSNYLVCLEHIFFIRNGAAILKDINLRIAPGQHWAIIGHNGSGKTSLISIINGYHRPSEGKAIVLGRKFGSSDLRELRLDIGECSSEIRDMIHPWEPAMDIVLSGKFASIGLYEKPDPADNERASGLLEFFGLMEMKDRPFNTLSDGEKQKILIARALMPGPQLLILDEPCAGLDVKAREEILDAVQKMCADGPALIYITHHIEEILPEITHVLVLKRGSVIAGGIKEKVLTSEILSRAFGIPIELYEKDGRSWPMVLKGQDNNIP